jgi:hypothetical protein
MVSAETCTVAHAVLVDARYQRVRYGGETDDYGAGSGARCHDCNVAPGGLHHPGCDVERCPRCGGQQVTCACRQPDFSAPASYSLPEVIEPCARKLWEAAQVPGCRRPVMILKIPRGFDQVAVGVRLEVDEDGDVVLLTGRDRVVIVRADGASAASGE